MTRDPRIDAYIEHAAPFARPILAHARELVHKACPKVEETIKWGMPTFVHAGGILCGMAAFKHHASFGFWKHALVVGEGEPRDGKQQPRQWIAFACRLHGQCGRMTKGGCSLSVPSSSRMA